jgi:hypothetical protein
MAHFGCLKLLNRLKLEQKALCDDATLRQGLVLKLISAEGLMLISLCAEADKLPAKPTHGIFDVESVA